MLRLLAALLLVSASAWAQGGAGGNQNGGLGGSITAPAAALLNAQGQAPLTNLLTAGWGTGSLTYTQASSGNTTSAPYFTIGTIEGAPLAIRGLYAELGTLPFQILSAWVYPSDSFSGMRVNGTVQAAQALTTFLPTQNSVYVSCNLTTGSSTATCTSTTPISGITGNGTVYVFAPAGTFANNQLQPTATVTNGTQISLSLTPSVAFSGVVQFANKSTGYQLCFDDKGAATRTIHVSCTNTGVTFSGVPGSTNSTATPYVHQVSDLVPFTAIPRTDGGSGYIVAIFTTVGPYPTTAWGQGNLVNGGGAGTGGGYSQYNTLVSPLYGYRDLYSGSSYYTNGQYPGHGTGSADLGQNPEYTSWRSGGGSPNLGVQYVTSYRGFQVMTTGTSGSQMPLDANGMATPIKLAAAQVSTPEAPVEVFNTAVGGQGTPQWLQIFENDIGWVVPSAVVYETGSANDYPANAPTFLAAFLNGQAKQYAYRDTPFRIGLWGNGPCNTCYDGLAGSVYGYTVFQTMQALLPTLSRAACQPSPGGQLCPNIPLLDATIEGASSYGGNAWDYPSVELQNVSAASAGATSITLGTTYGGTVCHAGDKLLDVTTPAALSATASVSANYVTSATTIAVTNTSIIGSGVQSGDNLICAKPSWSAPTQSFAAYDGGAYSIDGTHCSYTGCSTWASKTFMQQLLGLQ